MKKNTNKSCGSAQALVLLATLLSGAALALYLTNGTNKLCPELRINCIIALAAAAGLGVLMLLWSLIRQKMPTLGGYAMYIAGLVGFAEYIVSQLNYIANVIYGVDGNSFTPVMIATAAASLLGWVLSFAAANKLRRAAYKRDLAAQKGEV